jgi:hypothetical protein
VLSRRWGRGAWLLALPLAAGCGLFDPRDPDPPGDEEQVPWNPPTAMAVALGNIQRTLEAKSVTNYDRSIATEELSQEPDFRPFTFVPDAVDAQIIGETYFESWDRQQEVTIMGQIIDTSADVSLEWTVRDSITTGSAEAYYEDIGYSLAFSWADRDTLYSGNADLYFIEDNGQWFLTRWEDKRDGSGHETWGMLRRQGSVPE